MPKLPLWILLIVLLATGCAPPPKAGYQADISNDPVPELPTTTLPGSAQAAPPASPGTASPSPSPFATALPTSTRAPTKTATATAAVPSATATMFDLDSTENQALADLAELRRQQITAEEQLRLSYPTPNPLIPTFEPNLMGDILVLMYHKIGHPEATWTRSPENLRADMEYLVQHGFYPVNLIDLAMGQLDHVPVGRRPVVLTFDDSTYGQFRYLADGSIDPTCAVGILLAMQQKYGADWPLRATFFVLLREDEPGGRLFGEPDLGPLKVRTLVELGMEVGSHTITHPSLREVDADLVQWELAVAQERIESLLPNYAVRSLSLPEGGTPRDPRLLEGGYSETAGLAYTYSAVVKVGFGPAPSPLSPDFDPYAIPRIRASQDQLDLWWARVEESPERYYVSAGR